ncbi:MAG: hypothetical protein ABWW69_01250 [Pyrodictiaceae archaeon]
MVGLGNIVSSLFVLSFLLALGQLFYDVAGIATGLRYRRPGIPDIASFASLIALSLAIIAYSIIIIPQHLMVLYTVLSASIFLSTRIMTTKQERMELKRIILADLVVLILLALALAYWGVALIYDPRGGVVLSILVPIFLGLCGGSLLVILLPSSSHGPHKAYEAYKIMLLVVSMTGTIVVSLWSLLYTSYIGGMTPLPLGAIFFSNFLVALALLKPSFLRSRDELACLHSLSSSIAYMFMVAYLSGLINSFVYHLLIPGIEQYLLISVLALIILSPPFLKLYRNYSALYSLLASGDVRELAAVVISIMPMIYLPIRLLVAISEMVLADLTVLVVLGLMYMIIFVKEKRTLSFYVSTLIVVLTSLSLLSPVIGLANAKPVTAKVLAVEPGEPVMVSPNPLVAHGFFLVYGALKGYKPAIAILISNVTAEEAAKRLSTIGMLRSIFENMGVKDPYNISTVTLPNRLPSMIIEVEWNGRILKAYVNPSELLAKCRVVVRPYSKAFLVTGIIAVGSIQGMSTRRVLEDYLKLYLWMVSRPEYSRENTIVYSIYAAELASWCLVGSLGKTFTLMLNILPNAELPVKRIIVFLGYDYTVILPLIALVLFLFIAFHKRRG